MDFNVYDDGSIEPVMKRLAFMAAATPDGLTVSMSLNLSGTKITALPKGLKVGGKILGAPKAGRAPPGRGR